MKIVILDGSAANPGDITWGALEDLGEVTAYDTTSKEQLIERMQGAEAAITNKTVFDRDVFEKLPDLNISAFSRPAITLSILRLQESTAWW